MSDIDFDNIYYYIKPTEDAERTIGTTFPESIKNTYEKLGDPRS